MISRCHSGFDYQLTEWFKRKECLEFAIKMFRDDPKRDCVIKKREKGYAVFTEGKFIEEFSYRRPVSGRPWSLDGMANSATNGGR